jgi:hypothetical protein
MENAMRKLVLALAIGLLTAGSATVVAPQKAVAAPNATKVVIVVGATQGSTASYRQQADQAAAVFAQYTDNITKVYSPNATWAAVQAAARGANVLVYLGHGSGFPNPYVGYLQPNGDNGMGLNASAAGSDNNTAYYGENYMASLGLAANAVVILNHLCYASGDSEWGSSSGRPTLDVAKTRVDGYASGFIRGGAKAVIADGVNGIGSYIDGLFTAHTTVDALWKSRSVGYHNNLISYPSSRNPGYTSQMDPDIQHPAANGDYYYRSMVSIPTLMTDDVISGQIPQFVSAAGTYHPIENARVIDTRGNGIGPTGKLNNGSRYTFTLADDVNVPKGAIAVTANLTITNQTSPGWLYIGPTIWGTPQSSTINFPVRDNRANGVTVALSTQGTIDAWYYGYPGNASLDVIIDVTGYYLAGTGGDGYMQYGPKRFVDTRINLGLAGRLQSGHAQKVTISGVQGLPPSGITAVVGNVTAVYPSVYGYVYVGPTAADAPTNSTVNFQAGDIRANNFVVKVAPDGTIGVVFIGSGNTGTADLVMDISGYYMSGTGAQFHTLDPTRILDSRVPTGFGGPVPPNSPRTLNVWGVGKVPGGALGITANLTVTAQTRAGFVSVGPTISAASPFSNLNYPYGDDRANGICVPLDGSGNIQLVVGPPTGGGPAHLIVDVNGYFL